MKYILTIGISLLFFSLSHSQVEMNSAKTVAIVKASYIYNFAKNCQWDDSFYETESFKIAVYGDRDLHDELLDKYSTKPLNSQIIEVVWVTDPELLFNEQILVVSKEKKNELQELSYIAEENGSLLITDFEGALNFGSIINFVVFDRTIAFNVNIVQAEKNLIQLGNRVKNWANKIWEK